MRKKQTKMLVAALLITTVLLVCSLIWLYSQYQAGSASKNWIPTKASVVANDADLRRTARGQTNGVEQWKTSIEYSVAGKQYSAVVDDYLVGSNVTVYVNPADPNMVVGKHGPKMEDIFIPIIASVGSGLFLVISLAMIFSPQEEHSAMS